MPGLAASPKIFEYIKLPTSQFEVHYLDWFPPSPQMDLTDYARMMAEKVTHEDPVLVGVSFGGMLIQEMAQFLNPRKLIVISSIKCRKEMPRRLLLARYTSLHKLLPTGVITNLETLTRFAFGDAVRKRLKLYERYLGIRDKEYLNWALDAIVNWEREEPEAGLVHIHGDQDAVFPFAYLGPCLCVKGGTHTMIIHRYKWFNERLPAIILEEAGSI
ncbi:alpha/beta fold hydrolase [Robiginitalea aurantiaca]|uniref:Alpha/beta hydrolase n=1 Tax=Robiginitalea aurantiaca TaxID=3056915 RepID=A0ABT7WCD1_9FLAO|nr:alpha/beta hydrolase [Robiginitalea aurantiaca]MDM9630576.1 alpha/beta hydrolase [Robiginitalea aurantiaca]